MKAVVVFCAGIGWRARLLRRGFGHCFVVLCDGHFWIIVDGQEGVPFVRVVAPAECDIAAFYRAEGCTVVETEQGAVPPVGPLAVANCTGLCKALLCIRAPWVLTPRQLYRRLTKRTA